MRSLALLDGPADHPAVLPCEIGTNKHVILSEAKDLKLRILRSFAVFAAQDDVSRFVIYTPLARAHRARTARERAGEVAGHHQRVALARAGAEVIRGDGDGVRAGGRLRDGDHFD